jgi:hypothetical protein
MQDANVQSGGAFEQALENRTEPASRANGDDIRRYQRQHTAEGDLTSSLLPSADDNDNGSEASPLRRQNSLRRAIRRLGNYLAYFTLIAMLIFVPIVLYRAVIEQKFDLAAYNSAFIMVCGTIVISVRLVYLHLTHWYMPEVQKYVVRIVWMVPLYATQSYLSLRFYEARIYIDAVRDFYEAYVIASFVYYLMELLGGQDALVELLRSKDPSIGRHNFPLNLILQPWELGLEFTLQCKHGVLQYVVFKSISTFLTFICESAGVYGEGKFEWLVAYPYLCFLQNLSVMYALYCLVMLYHAVEADLRHPTNWRPLGKFLCVKAIVFFCWWQGVVIYYLRAHGIIESLGTWSSQEVADCLIDYCVVIEMVGFAIAHSYTFTYKEYLPNNLSPEVAPASGMATSTHTDHSETPRAAYRAPTTLPEPMTFKDAFWSSTVPKETLKDIQRLRTGVDSAITNTMTSPPSISLQEISFSDRITEDSLPEHTFV